MNTMIQDTSVQNTDFQAKVNVAGQQVPVVIPLTPTTREDMVRTYLAAEAAEKAAKKQKDEMAEKLLKECGKESLDIAEFTVTPVFGETRSIDTGKFIEAARDAKVEQEVIDKCLKVDAKALDGLVKANILLAQVAKLITKKSPKKAYVVISRK
jgi:hypothetical protein